MENTAREITTIFNRLGADVSKGLSAPLSKAFPAFDTSGARAELLRLESAWRRAADVEADAARRMEVAAKRASEATAKYGSDSAKAMQAQAVAAKGQRDYVDAVVANEAAHKANTRAMQDSAATATVAGRAFNAVGIGATAVLAGGLVAATKAAADFQQSQTKLVAATGESTAGLKTLSDGILNLSGQVGYSAQQISKAAYWAESQGYHAADAVKVMTSATPLAKVENADLDTVTKGLTLTMHDFNIPLDQAAITASKLNTGVGLASTNLEGLTGALHSVAPTAAALGISLDSLIGSLAQITRSGMGVDQAADNMNHAMVWHDQTDAAGNRRNGTAAHQLP